jgi:glycosyltransferase involved in cell wall biosynthesis
VQVIRQAIRERDIDVVVLAGHVNIQGALAARLERRPVVWQILDTRTPAVLDEALLRMSRRLADAVMTTGNMLAERHKARLGRHQGIVPFYPPVDCMTFTPARNQRAEVRREWRIPADVPVLGAVANLNPQKGIEQLIRALADVRWEQSGARLVVIGAEHETHKGYLAMLRREMDVSGLLEGIDVIFTGPRDDVPRLLQGFDVLVMGSVPHSEGVPTSILEAMASGLPVVATDVGGVSEVVEHGITGLVVPPLQPKALADAVLEVLGDSGLRHQMSEAARQRAVKRFGADICVESHLRALEMAMSSHRQREEREGQLPRAA